MAQSCFDKLHLSDDATPAQVKARWHELAREHHPDKGGNAAVFAELRQAYEEATRIASQPKPCPVCDGTGKVTQRLGFSAVRLRCLTCKGSGKLL